MIKPVFVMDLRHDDVLRARFMIAGASAFTSQDTYLGQALDPLSQNRYAYCAGDPVNASDPTGHALAPHSRENWERQKRMQEYRNEARRREAEARAAKTNPALVPAIRARRSQYNSVYSLGVNYARTLSAMPSSPERDYLVWSLYNNGWISRESAEKYCGSLEHMEKEAPVPMKVSQCMDALDALQKGVSCGLDAVRASNATGWAVAQRALAGIDYGEQSIATIDQSLKGAGKVVGAAGFVIGVGVVAADAFEAYNNPNVTPDRAASDAYMEFHIGSAELIFSTAAGSMASYLVGGAVAGSFGGPAGIVAGVVAGLVVGISALVINWKLEESGIKQQWKDDHYAATKRSS